MGRMCYPKKKLVNGRIARRRRKREGPGKSIKWQIIVIALYGVNQSSTLSPRTRAASDKAKRLGGTENRTALSGFRRCTGGGGRRHQPKNTARCVQRVRSVPRLRSRYEAWAARAAPSAPLFDLDPGADALELGLDLFRLFFGNPFFDRLWC